jgi:hypothetical protein
MPQWKKVIMSGSNISALNNDANYITSTDSDPITGSLVSKGFQAIGEEHTIGGTDIQEDTTSINVSSSAIVTPSRASTNPYNNYFGSNGDPLGIQGFKFLPQSTPQRLQSYRFNSSENKTNILLDAGFAGDAASTFHQLKTGSAFEIFGLNTGTKADGFNPFGGGFNELYTGAGIYNNLTTPEKLPPYASDNTPGVGMTIGGINHDQTNSQTTSSFFQAELLCYPGKNYRNNTVSNKWASYQSGLSINLLTSRGGTSTSVRMREALRITDQYVYVPGNISASGDLFVDTLTTAGEVTFKGEETKFETTIIGASPIGVNDTFIITGSRQNRTGSFTNPAIIASGSTALNTIGSLKFESLSSTSETTGLVINSSDVVSKRAFGTNAFTSTSIPTAVTDLSDVSSAGSGQIITTSERNAITTNSAKTGISTGQSSAIVANTAKTSFPGFGTSGGTALEGDTTTISSGQSSAIVANTAKTGITTGQSSAIVANTAKTGITSGQSTAIAQNSAKTGISTGQSSAIVANTAKTGISTGQSSAIVANTAKVTFPGFGTTSATALVGNTALLQTGTTSGTALAGNTTAANIGGVATTGTQTVAGVKTFSSIPIFSSGLNIGSTSVTAFVYSNALYITNSVGAVSVGGGPGVVSTDFAVPKGSVSVGNISNSTTDGRIDASNDIVAFSTSDKKLKKKIKNIPNALEKISQINGVTFEWKKTDEKMKKEVHSNEGHDVGVIAQEVEKVLPEVVITRDNGYKAVKYEKIIPLLVESIKELKAEIEELKNNK